MTFISRVDKFFQRALLFVFSWGVLPAIALTIVLAVRHDFTAFEALATVCLIALSMDSAYARCKIAQLHTPPERSNHAEDYRRPRI